MASLKVTMASWWGNLEYREQLLIAIAGLLLVFSVAFFLVWQPLQSQQALLSEDIQSTESLLNRLNAVAPGQTGKQSNKIKGQDLSLLAVVDKTVKAAGMGDSVKRIQPDGEAAAKIWLEKADFNKLLRWINQLNTQYGVDVSEITINREDTPGQVRARLGFQRI